MICFNRCVKCKHQRENIDGWKCACDAFPDGIPSDFKGRSLGQECANGIGYEPDPERAKIYNFIPDK